MARRYARQLRFTREGRVFVLVTLGVGAAAVNTGNNLLYLVLGMLLSLIVLSGVLSELVLRHVSVQRRLPRRAFAGSPSLVELSVHNEKRRFPSYSIEVEDVAPGEPSDRRCYFLKVGAGETQSASYRRTPGRRGVLRFAEVRVRTRYPFGLFEKTRRLALEDELVVYPALAPVARPVSGLSQRGPDVPTPRRGHGNEPSDLREYRDGDEARSIHWRRTASLGRVVVRERLRDASKRLTLLVDERRADDRAWEARFEHAISSAAATAARALDEGLAVEAVSRTGSSRLVLPGQPPDSALALSRAARAGRGRRAALAGAGQGRRAPLRHGARGRVTFGGLHKLVTYLIAGLGLAALFMGSELTWPAEALIGVGYVASFFAEGKLVRDPRWIRGWTVAALAFVALEVLRGLLGAPLLPLALEVAAALQVSRLMNRRGAREHQQIAALALLHLIAATVLSTEITYGLAFVGFVVVAPWMLALSHLRAEIEGQLGSQADRERSVERVLASKRVVGPGFLAGTAALSVPLFAMTGLLFVAFPRVGLGFLSFGQGTGQRISGFGADVELGDFGLIRTDPTVVLRVTPPDLPPQPPDRMSIRMRGTSFDHYDGRRWTRGLELRPRGVGRLDNDYALPRRLPNRTRDRPWQVVLDGLDEPVVFTPPHTVGLEIPPRVTGGLEVGREILYSPGVDIRYADADGLGLRYTAWTSDRPRDRDRAPPDPDTLRRDLEVPQGHARVAALAREWTRGAHDDEERVHMLLARLRDSGEYTYSLQMPEVGERVPLEVFLLGAKRGHCEYFSTALAIMARTLGIPTRNVTGFLGGQLNPYGGYYALSQGDAHSWVEVFLPDAGWVTVDPTPPARDAIAVDHGWLRRAREMVDAVRTRWAHDVVGYDLHRQVSLFRGLRRLFGASDAPTERGIGAAASVSSERSRGWIRPLVALLALVGGAVFVWRRRFRRAAGPAEDAIALYRALDAALARLGHPRPKERTPLEHVEALERADFVQIDLVREVTRRYLDARYGGETLDPDEATRLGSQIATLRRERRPRPS